MGFWFGFVCGAVAGGFFTDVNLRAPEWLKEAWSNWWSKDIKTKVKA